MEVWCDEGYLRKQTKSEGNFLTWLWFHVLVLDKSTWNLGFFIVNFVSKFTVICFTLSLSLCLFLYFSLFSVLCRLYFSHRWVVLFPFYSLFSSDFTFIIYVYAFGTLWVSAVTFQFPGYIKAGKWVSPLLFLFFFKRNYEHLKLLGCFFVGFSTCMSEIGFKGRGNDDILGVWYFLGIAAIKPVSPLGEPWMVCDLRFLCHMQYVLLIWVCDFAFLIWLGCSRYFSNSSVLSISSNSQGKRIHSFCFILLSNLKERFWLS